MLTAILRMQWRASRLVLLIIALGLAIVPFQLLRSPEGTRGAYAIGELVNRSIMFGAVLQSSTVMLGLIIAMACWQSDLRTRHVYALSLPVARSKYVLMRFIAGLALHVPVAAVLAMAGVVAVAMAPLPPVLHAYPLALAFRWLLGGWTVFSLIFVLLSMSQRAARILVTVLLTVVVVDLALAALGVTDTPYLIESFVDFLKHEVGPFGSFASRWMLIDV